MRAFIVSGGRILGRNRDKSLKSFPPRFSQSSPLTDFTSPSSLSKSGLYRNFKSENSQDYAQKPQRNCTFMNSASAHDVQSFVHLNFRLLSFMARAFFLAEDKKPWNGAKFPFHVPAVKIETGRWLNGQADFLETSGVGQELNYSGQLVAYTKYLHI